MAKPFRYLNPRRDHALVTILRYYTPAGAFSKNRKVLFGHKQPVFRQFWYIVLQFIHRFRTGNVVWQVGEQVSQNFGAQDLMYPYLEPGFSLEVNIAKWVFNFARIESQFGIIQRCPASAE